MIYKLQRGKYVTLSSLDNACAKQSTLKCKNPIYNRAHLVIAVLPRYKGMRVRAREQSKCNNNKCFVRADWNYEYADVYFCINFITIRIKLLLCGWEITNYEIFTHLVNKIFYNTMDIFVLYSNKLLDYILSNVYWELFL